MQLLLHIPLLASFFFLLLATLVPPYRSGDTSTLLKRSTRRIGSLLEHLQVRHLALLELSQTAASLARSLLLRAAFSPPAGSGLALGRQLSAGINLINALPSSRSSSETPSAPDPRHGACPTVPTFPDWATLTRIAADRVAEGRQDCR